jgi:hypothetical protein
VVETSEFERYVGVKERSDPMPLIGRSRLVWQPEHQAVFKLEKRASAMVKCGTCKKEIEIEIQAINPEIIGFPWEGVSQSWTGS